MLRKIDDRRRVINSNQKYDSTLPVTTMSLQAESEMNKKGELPVSDTLITTIHQPVEPTLKELATQATLPTFPNREKLLDIPS